jgi:putative hydrolase of the HAD superfamily
MNHSKYEAVIFDFFGTLVPSYTVNAYQQNLSAMAEELSIPSDFFIEKWLGTFRERAIGKIPDVHSNIDTICNEFGVSPRTEQVETAIEIRLGYAKENIRPKKGAINILAQIKSLGVKLGLITDCAFELPELWDKTEFAPCFDVALFSCMEGIKKPDPAIYKKASVLLEVVPEKCLYVGDGGSNELTGARNVGMTPVLIFDKSEQGNPDTHRIDGEKWHGTVVYSFREVIGLLRNDE